MRSDIAKTTATELPRSLALVPERDRFMFMVGIVSVSLSELVAALASLKLVTACRLWAHLIAKPLFQYAAQ